MANEDLLVSKIGFKAVIDIGKTNEVITARCSPHHTALIIMVIIVGYKKDIVGISCNLPYSSFKKDTMSYYPGQIVWSVKQNKPVSCDDEEGLTRHFINSEGKPVCPKSIKEAKLLLKRNRIVAAPVADHWCWSCDGRLHEKPRNEACEALDEHLRCKECNGFNIDGTFLGKMVCRECRTKLSKDGLRVVAEELLKEILLIKTAHDDHARKAAQLIDNLSELNDPYKFKQDGRVRDEIDRILRNARRELKP